MVKKYLVLQAGSSFFLQFSWFIASGVYAKDDYRADLRPVPAGPSHSAASIMQASIHKARRRRAVDALKTDQPADTQPAFRAPVVSSPFLQTDSVGVLVGTDAFM